MGTYRVLYGQRLRGYVQRLRHNFSKQRNCSRGDSATQWSANPRSTYL